MIKPFPATMSPPPRTVATKGSLSSQRVQPGDQILPNNSRFFDFFESRFDSDYGILWEFMKPNCPPKFTRELLDALREGQAVLAERLREQADNDTCDRINYQVFGSKIRGIFSYGGDILLFRDLIAAQDREGLFSYACDCIDVVYTNAMNYRQAITTISLVQGDALGGGFEAALAANVVVAERGCQMGLPEVKFNLFPGMGAYQLLTHRLPPIKAERFIAGGKTFAAEELFDMGLVDVLAEPGTGDEAVRNYIRETHCQLSGRQAIRAAMAESALLDYDELRRVAEIWVDRALNLRQKDLDVLNFLIQAQSNIQRPR